METIRRRLEFALIMTLFFPVIVDALFKDNTQESGDVTLRLGLAIACLVLSFFILELYKNGVNRWVEKSLNGFLLLEIIAFVPVLFLLSMYQGEVIKYPVILLYQASLIGIYILPIFVLFMFVLQIFVSLNEKLQSKLTTKE